MATAQSFEDMLNEYLPNALLTEEFVKRDYVFKTADKDDNWDGGPLIVPFKGAYASSTSFGSLTASNDIAEDVFVRGQLSGPKELWGTMKFNARDLMEHGAVSEQNFLRILPDTLEAFMQNTKNLASTAMLSGGAFATLLDVGNASGEMVVDHPDRFTGGMKVQVDDGDSAPVTGYVKTVGGIDMEEAKITLVTARGGATPVDLSDYAAGAKVYSDNAQANAFTSLRDSLLSAANGGSATLYGVTKTDYPYTQAINISGAEVTKANILEKIFLAMTTVRRIGKGNPNEALMSYQNLAYAMAVIESSKGAFNVVPGSTSASQYGWTEITVGSITKGPIKLIGIQEADNDVIMFIDWRAITIYSNGGFRKQKSPDGNEFYVERATTGYTYIVDVCYFGDLVLKRPSYCGIMHSIPDLSA